MRDDYQSAINNDFGVQNSQGVKIDVDDPRERLKENYTNKDSAWHSGTHSGDIYISTPDSTHNLIVDHHNHMHDTGYDGKYDLPEKGYPGTSGYFTNEETAARSFTADGKFDSMQLGHDLQQAPHYNESLAMQCESQGKEYFPEYNGHLDCFKVNEAKMLENYGTTDFYAAMSQCKENAVWGEGGGFQGYNPYINQMINNGSLEYLPEKSRSCNSNQCLDYSERKGQAQQEAAAVNNYIENNGIKGEPGQRIGYNEISQSANISNGTNVSSSTSNISSSNVVSIGGGGARAPDNQPAGPNLIDIDPPRNPQINNDPITAGPQNRSDFTQSLATDPVQNVVQGADGLTALPTPTDAQNAAKSVTGGIT